MLELRHRGGCPGPGGAGTPPPREGEAAGGDHETESTSDKVSECGGAGPRPWSGRVAGVLRVFPRPGACAAGVVAPEPDCTLASFPDPFAQGSGWNPSPQALWPSSGCHHSRLSSEGRQSWE